MTITVMKVAHLMGDRNSRELSLSNVKRQFPPREHPMSLDGHRTNVFCVPWNSSRVDCNWGCGIRWITKLLYHIWDLDCDYLSSWVCANNFSNGATTSSLGPSVANKDQLRSETLVNLLSLRSKIMYSWKHLGTVITRPWITLTC